MEWAVNLPQGRSARAWSNLDLSKYQISALSSKLGNPQARFQVASMFQIVCRISISNSWSNKLSLKNRSIFFTIMSTSMASFQHASFVVVQSRSIAQGEALHIILPQQYLLTRCHTSFVLELKQKLKSTKWPSGDCGDSFEQVSFLQSCLCLFVRMAPHL